MDRLCSANLIWIIPQGPCPETCFVWRFWNPSSWQSRLTSHWAAMSGVLLPGNYQVSWKLGSVDSLGDSPGCRHQGSKLTPWRNIQIHGCLDLLNHGNVPGASGVLPMFPTGFQPDKPCLSFSLCWVPGMSCVLFIFSNIIFHFFLL